MTAEGSVEGFAYLDWTQQIVQEGPCPVLSCWWVVPRSCRIGSPEDPRRNPSVRTRHQMLLQQVFFWRRTAPDLHRSSISPFLEDDVKAKLVSLCVRFVDERKSPCICVLYTLTDAWKRTKWLMFRLYIYFNEIHFFIWKKNTKDCSDPYIA